MPSLYAVIDTEAGVRVSLSEEPARNTLRAGDLNHQKEHPTSKNVVTSIAFHKEIATMQHAHTCV